MLQCIGVVANAKATQLISAWLQQPGASADRLGPAETFVHALARCVCWGGLCVCVRGGSKVGGRFLRSVSEGVVASRFL